jgi:hypothetical protein
MHESERDARIADDLAELDAVAARIEERMTEAERDEYDLRRLTNAVQLRREGFDHTALWRMRMRELGRVAERHALAPPGPGRKAHAIVVALAARTDDHDVLEPGAICAVARELGVAKSWVSDVAARSGFTPAAEVGGGAAGAPRPG